MLTSSLPETCQLAVRVVFSVPLCTCSSPHAARRDRTGETGSPRPVCAGSRAAERAERPCRHTKPILLSPSVVIVSALRTATAAAMRCGRKRPPSHGGPTRTGAQRSEHRNPAWCVAGPAGPPSSAEAVAVVTARRAGTRTGKPSAASTRDIVAAAQANDRRESERSERFAEHDRRAPAMAQRARQCGHGGGPCELSSDCPSRLLE